MLLSCLQQPDLDLGSLTFVLLQLRSQEVRLCLPWAGVWDRNTPITRVSVTQLLTGHKCMLLKWCMLLGCLEPLHGLIPGQQPWIEIRFFGGGLISLCWETYFWKPPEKKEKLLY